jgi:outer membrane protein with beta-barrel domain
MSRWIEALFIAATVVVAASPVYAQEASPGPGLVQVTIIPGGATFVTEGQSAQGPSFGNYQLGGAVAFNFNRYVGIEGEVNEALGLSQDLQLGGLTSNLKSPNLLNYSGNLVVYARHYGGVVPYATGGIGSLIAFKRTEVGIDDTEAFLTGNVGGGLNWYAGRWGLRGDYRFIAIGSQNDAPAFFGQQTRYAHRVYGGVLLNIAR